jgi:hypothetical protein
MKQRFRVPEHVIERTLGEKTILLNLRSGDYYSLNGSGSSFWKGLSEGRPLGELAEEAGRTYQQPAEAVEADLAEFAGELRRLGLVEPAGEGE